MSRRTARFTYKGQLRRHRRFYGASEFGPKQTWQGETKTYQRPSPGGVLKVARFADPGLDPDADPAPPPPPPPPVSTPFLTRRLQINHLNGIEAGGIVRIASAQLAGDDLFWSRIQDAATGQPAGDLRVFADAAMSLPLPLQITSFDRASRTLNAWTRAGAAIAAVEGAVFLRVGNTGTVLAQPLAGDPLGSKAVWTGFAFVIHDPASPVDSAGNLNPAQLIATGVVAAAGPSGLKAGGFEVAHGTGSGDRVETGHLSDPQQSTMLVALWNDPLASSTGKNNLPVAERGVANNGLRLGIDQWTYGRQYSDGVKQWGVGAGPRQTWLSVGVTHDAAATAKPKLYLKGAEAALLTDAEVTGTFLADAGPLVIGNNAASAKAFSGLVSEIWALAVVKSPEFIAAFEQMIADPAGFAQIALVDSDLIVPGDGWTGDPDVRPGVARNLLQGGVTFDIGRADSNMYPSNLLRNSVNLWAVDLNSGQTKDAHWLVEQGLMNARGHWIAQPALGALDIKTIRLNWFTRFAVGGLQTTADDPGQYWGGKFIEISWTGGSGREVKTPFTSGASLSTIGVTTIVNDPNRIIVQLAAGTQFFAFAFDLTQAIFAGPGGVNWTSFKAQEVAWDAVAGDYLPVNSTNASKLYKDNTNFYDVIRTMDFGPTGATPMRSLLEMRAPNEFAASQGRSLVRSGRLPTEQLLADMVVTDQIPWIMLPPYVGWPVRKDFIAKTMTGGPGGGALTSGDLYWPDAEAGSYALVPGSFSQPQGGGEVIVNANGTWEWHSLAPVSAAGLVSFEFAWRDFEGAARTGQMAFKIIATSSGGFTIWDAAIEATGGTPKHAGNFAAISDKKFWMRSAVSFVDRLVASGHPPTKTLIIEASPNEFWNSSMPGYNYCGNLAEALGKGFNNGYGAGWIAARWAYFIRREIFLRAIGPYKLLFTGSSQTATPGHTTNYLSGARRALIDLGVDPARFIKPGSFEPSINSYLSLVWSKNGASGQATDAANKQWWLDAIANNPALARATYHDWLADTVIAHSNNAKQLLNQFALHEASAQSFGARMLGFYEGGSHLQLPDDLAAEPTIKAFYLDIMWAEETADAIRAFNNALAAAWPGRQLVNANYSIAGPRETNRPWNEGTWQAQGGSARIAMYKEFGRVVV